MKKITISICTGLGLALGTALFASSGLRADRTAEHSSPQDVKRREEMNQISRNVSKFYSQGDWNSALALSSKLGTVQGGRVIATCELNLGDYQRAYEGLDAFFGSSSGSPTVVSGAYQERAWYWLLTLKFKGPEQARPIKQALFAELPLVPRQNVRLHPEECSRNELCQVYLYLSAHNWWKSVPQEAVAYYDLAKAEDPGLKLPKGFAQGIDLYRKFGPEPMSTRLPRLDAARIRIKP